MCVVWCVESEDFRRNCINARTVRDDFFWSEVLATKQEKIFNDTVPWGREEVRRRWRDVEAVQLRGVVSRSPAWWARLRIVHSARENCRENCRKATKKDSSLLRVPSARRKELRCDDRMFSSPWAPYAPLLPFAIGREVERRAPILVLMIDVIASLKKLFHDRAHFGPRGVAA
jgi:hypothetical protein